MTPKQPGDADRRIAEFVAERIPNGATIQTGIGAIPNAIMHALGDHRDLGVHTELLSDGVVDLIESGVVNGVRKRLNRTKTVGTFALGTDRLHEFLHENTAVELHAVRYVNDPRIIATETNFVSVNATLTVDFLGQCASETIDGKYFSSSGGQNDFARGAMYSEGGQGFVVLRSTTSGGMSRIVPQLAAGDVVTTPKNTVDKVVTEWGVAELRGRTIRERTRNLIAIAHPDHRDATDGGGALDRLPLNSARGVSSGRSRRRGAVARLRCDRFAAGLRAGRSGTQPHVADRRDDHRAQHDADHLPVIVEEDRGLRLAVERPVGDRVADLADVDPVEVPEQIGPGDHHEDGGDRVDVLHGRPQDLEQPGVGEREGDGERTDHQGHSGAVGDACC